MGSKSTNHLDGLMRLARRSAGMACVAVAVAVAACVAAPSLMLVGRARAPISPDQVQLYLEPPAGKYEQIAVVDVSSKHSLSFTARAKSDVVIRRLKEQAAKLGANGLLLEQIADDPADTEVGTVLSTEHVSNHGTIDLGVSAALASQKFGRGTAIYLESGGTPGPASETPR
jgi:hypothetical protein